MIKVNILYQYLYQYYHPLIILTHTIVILNWVQNNQIVEKIIFTYAKKIIPKMFGPANKDGSLYSYLLPKACDIATACQFQEKILLKKPIFHQNYKYFFCLLENKKTFLSIAEDKKKKKIAVFFWRMKGSQFNSLIYQRCEFQIFWRKEPEESKRQPTEKKLFYFY